jgi:hypothetical protein
MVSCGAGLANCGGICRDTTTDRLNCGGCGVTCGAGQICSGSTCTLSCPGGTVACGGTCASTTTMTCAAPIDLGSLGTGSSTGSGTRVLAGVGQEDWFLVRFPQNVDFAQHGTGGPSISLALNDGNVFRFDVVTSCGMTPGACGAGAVVSSVTGWAFSDDCAGLGGCTSRTQTWPSTVMVRVRRVSGGVDCTSRYRLAFSR